jgi:magnesium chelatase subunit D
VSDLDGARAWSDARLAAELLAVDPVGLGGINLRARSGPVRERWLAEFAALLPVGATLRRVPLGIDADRLLGGLDLAATLAHGRTVVARGVLSESDHGFVLLAMAERISATVAAQLGAAIDWHEVLLERDGIAARCAARIGVVALDEGVGPDERPPPALLERLAFHVSLEAVAYSDLAPATDAAATIVAARARLARVRTSAAVVESLVATAAALGVDSLRAALLAVRAAKAAAALAGRSTVREEDSILAGRLVLAPRATLRPAEAAESGSDEAGAAEPPPESTQPRDAEQPLEAPREPSEQHGEPRPDVVLAAVAAAIPAGLLAALSHQAAARSHSPSSGRAGSWRAGTLRGRPAGVVPGAPGPRLRLSLIDTLRAAAPWQRLRRRPHAGRLATSARVEVRREDFHVRRFKARSETTTIFVVDASGSAAMHRLAEAKGAVELLLADCYVRRDRVALLAFRGRGAELLLPPTRSLLRAKRGLAGLPGGGGTPLAAGLDAGLALATAVARRGGTPTLVVLTDGRANVARDGAPGRARAEEDALGAARAAGAARIAVLFVDTAPRPQLFTARLAEAMHARYLPLPQVDALALSRAAGRAGGGRR